VTSRVVDRADCAVLVERSSEEPSSEPVPSESAADPTASDPGTPATREGQTEDRPLLVE
jgi:hypothetical protein